jgi:hypothetical protein
LNPYPASHESHIPKPFDEHPAAQFAEHPLPHTNETGLKAYPDWHYPEVHYPATVQELQKSAHFMQLGDTHEYPA